MDYNWVFELPVLSDSKCGMQFMSVMPDLSSRVVSIEAPNQNIDSKKNMRGAETYYTATNADIGTISLRVDEMEDGLSLEYFECWKRMIKNDKGLYYPPSFYKRTLNVIRLSSEGEETHSHRYFGVFPTNISSINYSYDGSGIMQYNITLAVDKVEHTFRKASGENLYNSLIAKPVIS